MRGRMKKLSRREFARGSALAAAAAALVGAGVAPSSANAQTAPAAPPPVSPPGMPRLKAASAIEAEARYQAILTRRGARLSAAQKTALRRSVFELQLALDALRAFPLENADEPALLLAPRPPRGR
jgi:hypothetical protein